MFAVPEWLLVGLLATGALAVVFAALFVLGERYFPTRPVGRNERDTGEWKRRAEIRQYLTRIDERYVEDRAVAGEPVAFYLPERGVAITFDAQAYFRIEAAGTHAVLVEHEMPGGHLGSRLPFETPDVTFGPGDKDDGRRTGYIENERDDGVVSAFEALGVDADADEAALRAAYRERVKEVHPDRGGSDEAFRRIQEAYTRAMESLD